MKFFCVNQFRLISLILLLCCFIFTSQPAHSLSVGQPNLAKLSNLSDVVAKVRILKKIAHGDLQNPCGYEYISKVAKLKKGRTKYKNLHFGRFENLDENKEYWVYLKYFSNIKDEKSFYIKQGRVDISNQTDSELTCDKLVPGYIFVYSSEIK